MKTEKRENERKDERKNKRKEQGKGERRDKRIEWKEKKVNSRKDTRLLLYRVNI